MASRLLKHKQLGDIRLYKRKGARALRISINHAGQVRVSLPYFMPYKAAEAYVNSKQDWITNNLPPKSEFKDGMTFAGGIRLKFSAEANLPSIRARYDPVSGILTVKHPANQSSFDATVQKRAADRLVKALIAAAGDHFPREIKRLSAQTSLPYKSLRIKRMTSRWGSCDRYKNITLNCFLLQLRQELADYVIIHELVHTRHPNHGAGFWQSVEQYVPDYKRLRKELHRHKPILKPLAASADGE